MTVPATRDDITLVMVTFNSAHCIDRIAPLLGQVGQVIVVDNASEDDTCDRVRTLLPQAQLIQAPTNLGFGAANNRALARVSTRYAFLMNPDCLPDDACLDALLAAAHEYPQAAILAPQILRRDGSLEVSYRWPSTRWSSRGPGASGPCCVGFATGAALLLNLPVMRPVGFFDEGFFLYYEDEDLCLRTFEAGLEIILVPAARMVHLSRGSTAGPRALYFEYLRGFHHAQSKIRFALLHQGPAQARALRRRVLGLALASVLPRLLWPHPRYLARLTGRIAGLIRLR